MARQLSATNIGVKVELQDRKGHQSKSHLNGDIWALKTVGVNVWRQNFKKEG
jgi:hypothetical protein